MAMTPRGSEPLLPWTEIGRAAPENEPWVAWIAQEGPELTLYRCLILATGSASVTIDLKRRGNGPMQRLHNAQCQVPPDRLAWPASIAALLEGADKATRHALGSGSAPPRAA